MALGSPQVLESWNLWEERRWLGGWVGVKDMDTACPCSLRVPPYPRCHSRQRHPPVVAAVPGRAWSQAPEPQSSP